MNVVIVHITPLLPAALEFKCSREIRRGLPAPGSRGVSIKQFMRPGARCPVCFVHCKSVPNTVGVAFLVSKVDLRTVNL